MKQLEMDKKIMFVIHPHSVVDVITNSSTELFVFDGSSKKAVEDIIKDVYPNYLDEYEELKPLSQLNDEDFESYLDWIYPSWDNRMTLAHIFNIEPESLYSNWAEKATSKYWYGELSKEGISLIRKQLDMDNTFLLYSIDENPDWEQQEKLMDIGTRHHLG